MCVLDHQRSRIREGCHIFERHFTSTASYWADLTYSPMCIIYLVHVLVLIQHACLLK